MKKKIQMFIFYFSSEKGKAFFSYLFLQVFCDKISLLLHYAAQDAANASQFLIYALLNEE